MSFSVKWPMAAVAATTLVAAGCADVDGVAGTSGSGTEVGGTVTAPGGMVAALEVNTPFEVALYTLDRVFPSAQAAISGLQPVTGADVELIRVDDDGNQVGEVLATTSTSTTGDYNLTVPAGTDLAGNLVVRITGQNDSQLRAQVVEQAVDIDPISEFVLQKFIESDASLESLETTAVVELKGQADEFDLAAGANLEEMFSTLEDEVGDFVAGQVEKISTPEGDVTAIAGDYQSVAVGFGLGDSEGQGTGTFFLDHYIDTFEMREGDVAGAVALSVSGNAGAGGYIAGTDGSSMVDFFLESYSASSDVESLVVDYTAKGSLIIDAPFEESIEGDFGFRTPPRTYRAHRPNGDSLFVLSSADAEVRYRTVDTDDDGQKDAIDPDQKDGDEVFRAIEFLLKKPQNATVSDLAGDYGRIYLGSYIQTGGTLEVEAERDSLTIDQSGGVTLTGGDGYLLNRDTGFSSESTNGGSATLDVTADGQVTGTGDAFPGFVNASFDVMVFSDADGVNDNSGSDNAFVSETILLELPDSAPTLADRNYRFQMNNVAFDGSDIALISSRYDSTMTFSSNDAATLDVDVGRVVKNGLAGAIGKETFSADGLALSATVSANGAAELTLPDQDGGDGVLTLRGYFINDASLGVFIAQYDPDGDGAGDVQEMGLAVLSEIN